jgi:predicted amidohydrolase YtcJ
VGSLDPDRRLAPLYAVRLAVERAGAGRHQAITVAEALRALTAVPAFTEGLDREKGVLRPGALADIVVLGADPTTVPPDRLEDIPVLATVVGGEVVYRMRC